MIGIYKLTNKINGKVYIGQSVDVEYRINGHYIEAKSSKPNSKLQLIDRAIRKYGAENFTHEIIVECTEDLLDIYETYFINEYNSTNKKIGYNIQTGGGHFRINEEGRKNISIGTRKAMVNVPREKLQSQVGPRTQETKDKISRSLTGYKRPKEFGEASSKRQKGKPKPEKDIIKFKEAAKRNNYKWVTNDIEELKIYGKDLDYYLSIGYRRGRLRFKEESIKKMSESHKKRA